MPTTKARRRPSASSVTSLARPIVAPHRSRRTAMILSTIICEASRSPVPSAAGNDRRYSGASR